MDALLASFLAFVAIFGGALFGVAVARRLPEPHLTPETRTAVSVSMAVVGTLSGLVVSLLLATANTAFRARAEAVSDLAVDLVRINRALIRFGPEVEAARSALKAYAQTQTRSLVGSDERARAQSQPARALLETLDDQIAALRPRDERQRHVQSEALRVVDAIPNARWILASDETDAAPTPLLVLLICWLAALFASFGLFAPRNGTVVGVLLLCALAISGGIFMILELGTATHGLITVSFEPLTAAIAEIGS